jgi:DNA-binding NarL/FixJ family response regulator
MGSGAAVLQNLSGQRRSPPQGRSRARAAPQGTDLAPLATDESGSTIAMRSRHRVVIANEGLSTLVGMLSHLDAKRTDVVAFCGSLPLFGDDLVGTDIDVWLIEHRMLRRLRRSFPDDLAKVRQSGSIVVLVASQKLQKAHQLADFVDGVVFADKTIAYLNDAFLLARNRHSLWPAGLLSAHLSEAKRFAAVNSLSESEVATLLQLGHARSNHAIALALNLPEATVKGLVRAVLAKLGFMNRTEAAVFAARHYLLNGRTSEAWPSAR